MLSIPVFVTWKVLIRSTQEYVVQLQHYYMSVYITRSIHIPATLVKCRVLQIFVRQAMYM